MDLWALHVKNTTSTSPLFHRNSFSEKPISWNPGKARTCFLGVEDGRVFEIRVSKRRVYHSSGFRSVAVRAMGKKNHGNSSNSSSGMLCFLSWNSNLHAIVTDFVFFFGNFQF